MVPPNIRVRGQRQKFTVEVEARVADGTTFLIHANGEPLSAVRIFMGEDEVEFKNWDGQTLPVAIEPVTSVSRVEVFDADGVLILELTI